MTEEFDLGEGETRILVDEPVWAPLSVLGNVATFRQQVEAFETLQAWGHWDRARGHQDRNDGLVERDRRLVKAARRWGGDPLHPPLHGRFVPGDVAAMRLAVVTGELAQRAARRYEAVQRGQGIAGTRLESAVALDVMASDWLYSATPYFVGLSTLTGLVDTEVPSAADLADLQLPSDVAVFFGGDIAVPMELVEDDDSVAQLRSRHKAAAAANPGWISADDQPPSVIDAATLTIHHRRPLRLCGVVLHATGDGQLDDLVMWLTSQPENDTSQRSILYGWLSRSMLRYVAVNIAAAVAWGQWTVPDLGVDLDNDPNGREFRDLIRRSSFRRREPDGGAVGVRVLDVRRTVHRPSGDRGGTHASPTTHLRRRHWRRQRVGPRDDWHYERRLIDPVVVNPGERRLDEPLTVYRLPLPPAGL